MKYVKWTFVALCGLALFGWTYVQLKGSVIVRDETGRVESAVIINSVAEWPLFRLPGGLFFRIPPRADGEIEVRCSDGSSARGGYVTNNTHISVRVVGDAPCQLSWD